VILEGNQSDQLANLKFNKQIKIVNLVPEFRSVPATSHLFDLVGSYIQYPDLALQTKQTTGGGIFSTFGSLFGRK
jgi:hypothetical protein